VAVIEARSIFPQKKRRGGSRLERFNPQVWQPLQLVNASIIADGKSPGLPRWMSRTRRLGGNIDWCSANKRLTDMALEFNRYNTSHRFASRVRHCHSAFNGVFNADDPESLIRFLESSDGIASIGTRAKSSSTRVDECRQRGGMAIFCRLTKADAMVFERPHSRT